ncbi:MAG: cytochrome c [bacterium]|nr:cytochrome c [bacterium]
MGSRCARPPRGFLGLTLLAFLLLGGCAEKGAKLFVEEGCAECHSFKGKGGILAPDLTAVTQRRDDGWLRKKIRNSEKLDGNNRMPPFEHLNEYELRSIIKYLKS